MAVEVPVVGAREACPCGSGRRYKACHGRDRDGRTRTQDLVTRPFEGLAGECDWVAMREIVPTATATLWLAANAADHAGKGASKGKQSRNVVLATVLPLAWPAMVRTDGTIYLGLQSPTSSGDISRDLAAALVEALALPPGSSVPAPELAADGPRLQDLLEPKPLDVVVHPDFGFWGDDMPDEDGELAASLERASEAVIPSAKLSSVDAAYWCQIGAKTHLRWVLPDAEEPLLDALARLQAARELTVGAGSRYAGAFRAAGLVVPVWDLLPGTEADDVEKAALELRTKLDSALAETNALTSAERRSRAGLLSRQVTLR